MKDLIQIIEGCKINDRKCQEKLYMKMYEMLFSLCRRFFDDNHDILSAINNGMLRVFKNIDQYNASQSELSTWVYAIVRNEALTLLRNQKSLKKMYEITVDLNDEMLINPFVQSAEEDLIHYLGSLKHVTRAVCTLFYAEGYTIKEIASAIDMKEGTVKWHLHEGRKKLQEIVLNKGIEVAKVG